MSQSTHRARAPSLRWADATHLPLRCHPTVVNTLKTGRFTVTLQRKGLAHQVSLLKEFVQCEKRRFRKSPSFKNPSFTGEMGFFFHSSPNNNKHPNKPGTPCFSSETLPTDRKSLKVSFKSAAQSHPHAKQCTWKKQPSLYTQHDRI